MCGMSDAVNLHQQVIQALGGKAKLAAMLDLDRHALSKWHTRGIPSRHWHKVISLAAAKAPSLKLTAEELDKAKPRTTGDAA